MTSKRLAHTVRSLPRRASFEARSRAVARDRASAYVDVVLRLTRAHPIATSLVPGTELVVDGFQGSGNSFFFVHFAAAQAGGLTLDGHAHSPAKLHEAVRRDTPAVLTLRPPRFAVASAVSRWPYLGVHAALRSYVRFHNCLLPIEGRLAIAPFEDVIADLGAVIRRLNRTFSTAWSEPAIVVEAAERSARSEERAIAKSQALAELDRDYRELLARATELYERFRRTV